jgi:hypothetical protein
MINSFRLKILICLFWLGYLGQVLSMQLYDPTLYSPILHLEKILVERAINLNGLFFIFLIVEASLLLYAQSALWYGYISGKWTYLVYACLSIFDNVFLSVQAFSWLDMIFIAFNYLLSGIILLALFSSPLVDELAVKKPFYFWKVFFTFFIFFILLFGVPYFFSWL